MDAGILTVNRSDSLDLACSPSGNAAAVWLTYDTGPPVAGRRPAVAVFDGADWGTPVMLSTVEAFAYPAVAYSGASGDELVVAHYGPGADGSNAVFVSYSNAYGASFAAGQEIDTAISATPSYYNRGRRVRVVSDLDRNVWVTWSALTSGSSFVAARSTDGGASFGAVRRADKRDPQGSFFNAMEANTELAATPGAGLFAWAGQTDSAHEVALFNADDIDDVDRDMADNASDNCPTRYNPAQERFPFDQVLIAPDKNSLTWENVEDVVFVQGPVSGVSSYTWTDSGLLAGADSIDTSSYSPAPGEGRYYAVRYPDTCGSWQTAPGNEPERDATLP